MRKLYLLFVVALALSLSSIAFAKESGEMHEAMAELEMVDESGYHGKAHLKDMGDGMTHVKVEIEGMSGDMSMPAHIHMGSMDNYDPKPKYPLNNVENGMSESTVEVSLEELTSEEHVIAVHMSNEDLTVVAVGDIHKMESEDMESEDGQHEDEKSEDEKSEDMHEDEQSEDEKSEDMQHEDEQSEDGQHEDMESEDEKSEDGQHEDMESEDEKSEDGQHEDMQSEDEKSEDGQHEDEQQSEDMPEDMPETGAGGMADSRNSAPVAGLALVSVVLAAGTLLVTRARNI